MTEVFTSSTEGALSFSLAEKKAVSVHYKNWQGESSKRTIIPEELYYGSTEWHPDEQWLLRAFDLDKEAYRVFALKDMQAIKQD